MVAFGGKKQKQMPKFKLVSRFSNGQPVWFIYEGKIKTGNVVGFESCVHKNYGSSGPRIEVEFYTDNQNVPAGFINSKSNTFNYELIKESEAFTSKSALLRSLQ